MIKIPHTGLHTSFGVSCSGMGNPSLRDRSAFESNYLELAHIITT